MTHMSTQQELARKLTGLYPNAVIKKIDKDNFLDIYLPELHIAKGTHLFFNTAKDAIKIGFYCRDMDFVDRILNKTLELEKYSQGLRLYNNPTFDNIDEAFEAAKHLLSLISAGVPKLPDNSISHNTNESLDLEANDESDNELGIPALRIPQGVGISSDLLAVYINTWVAPTRIFADRLIKFCVAPWLTCFNDSTFFSHLKLEESTRIIELLSQHKAIPVLNNAPEDVKGQLKLVWWMAPFCIFNDYATPIIINKNGIYGLYSTQFPDDIELTCLASWDAIMDLTFEYSYAENIIDDEDHNVNCLTIEYSDGELCIFELVDRSKNQGSYLSIVEEIWKIREPTITASKGLPMWKEGFGGEGHVTINSVSDLLKDHTYEDLTRLDRFL